MLVVFYLLSRVASSTYPNGTSKEGRTLDVSTKKLSVSLTLSLARRVTVTGIFTLLWHDTFPRRSGDTTCSLTPDQCGASTRCTKDALSQLCCKSVSSYLAELKDYVVRPGRESALVQLVAERKIQEIFILLSLGKGGAGHQIWGVLSARSLFVWSGREGCDRHA